MTESERISGFEFVCLFRDRKEQAIIECCEKHPDWLQYQHGDSGLVMLCSMWYCPTVLEYVLSKGTEDVNRPAKLEGTPLWIAITHGFADIAKILLESGADPDANRAIVSAVCQSNPKRLECLKLLLAHGAQVNKLYSMFGNKNQLRSALDFAATDEARNLLRAAGALTSAEILAQAPNTPIED